MTMADRIINSIYLYHILFLYYPSEIETQAKPKQQPIHVK